MGPQGYSYPGRVIFPEMNNMNAANRRYGSPGSREYEFAYNDGWSGYAGDQWFDNARSQFMGMQKPGVARYPGGYF